MIGRLLTSVLALATFASVVKAQVSENITISPLPALSTCQLGIISWTGGKAPYRAYIYPADWTNQSDWIVELPLTTRQQTSWNVNLAAGSGVVVNVWDGVNDEYSDPTWIQDSGDSSCLGFNGTMQSTIGSSVNQTLPTFASLPSTRPTVVSTPSAAPTSAPAPLSQSNAPSSTSSAPAPPATVTVVEGNAAFPTRTMMCRWTLVMVCVAIGVFTWL